MQITLQLEVPAEETADIKVSKEEQYEVEQEKPLEEKEQRKVETEEEVKVEAEQKKSEELKEENKEEVDVMIPLQSVRATPGWVLFLIGLFIYYSLFFCQCHIYFVFPHFYCI